MISPVRSASIVRAALLLAIFADVTSAQTPPSAELRTALPAPFWSSTQIAGEPLLFIKEPNQPAATARLLFQPSGDLRLTNAAGTQVYVSGSDYLWEKGTKIVTLTARSRIPSKTREEMAPAAGAPMSFGKTAGGQGVFFSEGHVFNDLQARATYTHSDHWDGALPSPSGDSLPRTATRLGSRTPLKMVVLGDSISAGYNATSFVKVPPLQPSYPELLAGDLRARFSSPITTVNLSVPGKTSDWGISKVPEVIAEKPDLLIVAFGMNDAEPSQAFADNIQKIIAQTQSACPGCDFVLVAGMTGNPLLFPPERFTGYRDALRRLAQRNVTLADVTTVWTELLRKKSFSDLTGNGVNHPNDFGHLLYAEVIDRLFVKN